MFIKKKTQKINKRSGAGIQVFARMQALIMLAVIVFPSLIAAQSPTKTPKFPNTPANFDSYFFKRTTVKPAINTIPFTEEELKKVAPGKISNGMVTITKRTRYREKDSFQTLQVPIASYLKELNDYEKFLNSVGETLRDGKFNKANPNDTDVQKDLGVLFVLRDRDKIINPINAGNKPNFILYEPRKFNLYVPYDPLGVLRPNATIRTNPGDLLKVSPNILANPNVSTSPVSSVGLLLNSRTSFVNSFKIVAGRKIRLVNGFTEIGSGIGKSYGGTVMQFKSGEAPIPGCQSKSKNYDDLGILQDLDDSCVNGSPNNKVKMDAGEVCDIDKPAADDPKCLYEGEISPKTYNMGHLEFDTDGGGNGWFGGYANFNLLARIQQQGKSVELNNSGIGDIGIEVFGSKIPLIEASNYFAYKSGEVSPKPDIKVKALPDFFDNLTLQSNFQKTIDGPKTRFNVGPVPIAITSGIDVKLGLLPDSSTFKNFPDTCTNPQTGSLRMFLGPEARADVWLKVAIDAFVASAGIKGKLVLVNDSFGAALTTEVAPSINRVTFKPELGYRFQHLAGKIHLFVEIDLLVYSKEWSIEVVSFDGFTNPKFPNMDVLLPKEPLVISSKKTK